MNSGARSAHGTRGVVASGHELATGAALDVLRDGGNAVDAAVCAALVLAVVTPYATSLGGDCYALVYEPPIGLSGGLNGTGRSPGSIDRERLGATLPRDGILSATVPGLLRALADLLDRYGSRDMRALIAPAIAFAGVGFPVHATFAANTAERASLLARDPAASALFLPGGAPPVMGSTFVQSDLAAVLQTVAESGVEAFYTGEIAERIVASCRAAGGWITADDLGAHASLWQAPQSVPFYGYDVATMPPNSYGATLLLQLLALEAGGIDRVNPASAEFIARGFAARRHAYGLAGHWVADPAFGEEAMRELIADAIASGGHFSDDVHAVPTEARDRCTTNVVVVDERGMAVSLIESVSAPYGSGVVLAGTGILLNNRMAGFSAAPGDANAVAAVKRPANTLAPCMVTRVDGLVMSVGTPGTVGQTCTLAQVLARMLACEQSAEASIAAPRWSVDFAGRLIVEDTMDAAVREAALDASEGAHVMPRGWISFGSIKLAAVAGDGVTAHADDRRAATAGAV